MTFSSGVSAWPRTTIAPISTMPWMKLDPDISGVCRITGTREMITWPAMAASMKMYSATKPSPITHPHRIVFRIITADERGASRVNHVAPGAFPLPQGPPGPDHEEDHDGDHV